MTTSNKKKTKSNKALEALINRISSGLQRTSVTSPSRWAETYRMMGGGMWSFDRHPWLKQMHDSTAEYNVGQKAAQMGYTETLLNLAFYTIDVLAKDVLYVLPNKNPNASDFSSGRFDPALELSGHLRSLFSDVDNIGHKRAGSANLYIRGSQSRADLKSLPISCLLMDEVAEFAEENIPLALQRTSGQEEDERITWMISTPTVEGMGISVYYNRTDKKHYYFKCPSCSRFIELKYPESIVICGDDEFDPRINETHLICYECKARLDHKGKQEYFTSAIWEPTEKNRDWSGFTISQMYSLKISPKNIAEKYFQSLINPADEVELFNSVLGLSHEVKGARVEDSDIDHCMENGIKLKDRQPLKGYIVTMGVDVGKWIHYEICAWRPTGKFAGDTNLNYTCIVQEHGKCSHFHELDALMNKYRIMHCVVDANPERRAALEFARRFPTRVSLCIFGRGIRGKSMQRPSSGDNEDYRDRELIVMVDRTSWLDVSLGRFKNHTISLPLDLTREYRTQVKIPVKSYTKDDNGNPVAKYLTPNNTDDHYAFSRCYAEVGLALVPMAIQSQNIEAI